MDFNSPLFLFLFLPFFLILYFVARRDLRPYIGLSGSLIFFAWGRAAYVPLMLAIIVFNFWLGRRLEEKRKMAAPSRSLLWLGVLANIGLLVFFKALSTYGMQFIASTLRLPDVLAKEFNFPGYPLGLSYISFQAVSYLIDVDKGSVSAEKSIVNFAFYIMFFPKLIVGPITRYGQLANDLAQPTATPDGVADGIRRFVPGLAKKVLIADVLRKIVYAVFAMPSPTIMPHIAWFTLLCFALVLYFDFSGYTDMAIGLGKMLGFTMPENFNYPYIAQSASDFWRRWHISLSSWFRDYVFFPLERHRIKVIGQPLNIAVVFILTGLWHGLTLNFLIWGLWYAAFLALESLGLGRLLQKSPRLIRHFYALFVILIGWVFFRSQSVSFSFEFIKRLFGDASGIPPLPFSDTSPLPFIDPSVWLAFGSGILLSIPVIGSLKAAALRILNGRSHLSFLAQAVGDVWVLFLFVASVAVAANGTFMPGIYRNF